MNCLVGLDAWQLPTFLLLHRCCRLRREQQLGLFFYKFSSLFFFFFFPKVVFQIAFLLFSIYLNHLFSLNKTVRFSIGKHLFKLAKKMHISFAFRRFDDFFSKRFFRQVKNADFFIRYELSASGCQDRLPRHFLSDQLFFIFRA